MATHPGGLITEVRPAVRTKRLVRKFGDRIILKELDLTIAPGEFTALLGRSGSGKSTLLRAVARLDHTVEGSGELTVPERVSLSFQDSRLLPWLRVLDNVILGLRGPGARERGLTALEEVGLAGRDRSWPHELSGGEQQRAALARALVREPELLLADEPFGALDALTRIKMHGLLRELYERHRPAVLLVTHPRRRRGRRTRRPGPGPGGGADLRRPRHRPADAALPARRPLPGVPGHPAHGPRRHPAAADGLNAACTPTA